ncbi:hypothetical protein EON65_16540 [archaeon]|nr:MAG: hypothetical protein EON65_16540 [archaeon]
MKEIPVWGIDCYTRTMIELAITERATADSVSRATVKHFIERVLLPSVNAQVPQNAHDMKVALMDIQVCMVCRPCLLKYRMMTDCMMLVGSGI